MISTGLLAGAILVSVAAPGGAQAARLAAAQLDPLLKARGLYNEGRYEAAIKAAEPALQMPAHRDAAAVIIGRAGLERYRTTADPADLAKARDTLRSVDPSVLSLRDKTDYVIGLGEALFFEELYQPAADLFESTLDEASRLGPAARDQVLDWWATAIDRHVRSLSPDARAAAYDRLIERMERELRADASSAAAAYWVPAAAFARGHVDRAWDAAIAGYVRALLAPDRGVTLRPDLDRLVREAIIPERARRLPPAGTTDAEQAQVGMLAEWEVIKERWARR